MRFLDRPYNDIAAFSDDYFELITQAAATIDREALKRAAKAIIAAYQRDAVIYSCGNGGSASIANHLVCDHTKGVGTGTALRTRVVSLSENIEIMTAISNDISYDVVFLHQLKAKARAGDLLIAISSSGNSENIVQAIDWCQKHDVETIALTGFSGGRGREQVNIAVHVDCDNYGIVEDLHQAIMHQLAQFIRQAHMDPDQISKSTF